MGAIWEHHTEGDEHVATLRQGIAITDFAGMVEERRRLLHPRIPELVRADGRSVHFARIKGETVRELVRARPSEAIALSIIDDLGVLAQEIGHRWFLRLDLDSLIITPAGKLFVTRMPNPHGLDPYEVHAPASHHAYYAPHAFMFRVTPQQSVGVLLAGLLHEICSGRPAFEGPTLHVALDRIRDMHVTLPGATAAVAERLEALCRGELPHTPGGADYREWIGLHRRRQEERRQHEALLQEVKRDPDGRDAYFVLADHLQSAEDIRGELIVLQSEAVAAEDPAKRRALVQRQTDLIHENFDLLMGPLADGFGLPGPTFDPIDASPHYIGSTTYGPMAAQWHMGYVRSLRFALDFEWQRWFPLRHALDLIPTIESTHLLRELSVGWAGADDRSRGHFWGPDINIELESLYIGPLSRQCTHAFGINDLSPFLEAVPGLKRLGVGALPSGGPGWCASSAVLEELRYDLQPAAPGLLRSALEGLFSSSFPALKKLKLACTEFGAREVELMAESKFVSGLDRLDLRDVHFTPHGREVFEQLRAEDPVRFGALVEVPATSPAPSSPLPARSRADDSAGYRRLIQVP